MKTIILLFSLLIPIKLYSQYEVSLFLQEAGTLNEHLLNNDIKELKLSGNLNDNDLGYIRDNFPHIKVVDIKDVKFVNNHLPSKSFYNLTQLEEVGLPDDLTEIGAHAFNGCENLVKINIPLSLQEIGEEAFRWCEKLTTINLPESLEIIGKCAFNFAGITDYKIPNSVKYIGESAFRMSKVQKIHLSDELKGIDRGLFYGCMSLNSVYLGQKIQYIEQEAFDWCINLRDIYCKAQNPPSMPSVEQVFNNTEIRNIKMYVDKESINDYRTDEIWGNFDICLVGEATSIEKLPLNHIYLQSVRNGLIIKTDKRKNIFIHSLNGSLVNQMSVYGTQYIYIKKGVYIISDNEKFHQKIMVY